MGNAVSHPDYYNTGKYEVIDVIEDQGWGEGFNRGNALKYIMRAKHKNADKEIEDLEKARWYIDREIQRLQKIKEKTITVNIDTSDCTVINTTMAADEIKDSAEELLKKSPFKRGGWLSYKDINRCLHTNEEEHIFENGKEIK